MNETALFRYEERRPGPAWRAFIECLWSATDPRTYARREIEQIVPDGCPELIVHLGDPFSRRVEGRWRRQGRAFLAGTLSRPWSLRAGRRIDTFGIRFRPGALAGLLDLDLRTTVDREVPLGKLVGIGPARRLAKALAAAPELGARARAAEAWLAELPARAAGPGDRPSVRAVELILARRGGVRVEEVARRLALSRRQLERHFARDLGIGPKLYSRIVRLQAALLEIGGDKRGTGVETALAAGYFDQSHLARDFRGLAGRPAARDRAADGELARHFTAPERLLALLAGE